MWNTVESDKFLQETQQYCRYIYMCIYICMDVPASVYRTEMWIS